MNFENTSNAYIDAHKEFVAKDLIAKGIVGDLSTKEIIPKLHFTYIVMEEILVNNTPTYSFDLRLQNGNNSESAQNEMLLRDKDAFYPLFCQLAVSQYDSAGQTLGNADFPKPYIDTAIHTTAALQAPLRTIWNNGATVQLQVNDDPLSDEIPTRAGYAPLSTGVTFAEKGFFRFRPNASVIGEDDPVLFLKLAPGSKASMAGAGGTVQNKIVATLAGFKYSGTYNSKAACAADIALRGIQR